MSDLRLRSQDLSHLPFHKVPKTCVMDRSSWKGHLRILKRLGHLAQTVRRSRQEGSPTVRTILDISGAKVREAGSASNDHNSVICPGTVSSKFQSPNQTIHPEHIQCFRLQAFVQD